jgi:hypothetical protein
MIVGELHGRSRTTAIIADSAYAIFCQKAATFSGIFATDEGVMSAQNVRDLSIYACVPGKNEFGPGRDYKPARVMM